MLLPFLVMVLKEYPSNDHNIRKMAIDMLNDACSTVNDKKIIERSGVMEPLVALLASADNHEYTKNAVRALIRKIVA